MEQIWTNIIDNWEILIYLSGLIVSFVFGRKKSLTEEEKLNIKLAKAEKKSEKRAKAFQKSLDERDKIKKEIENNASSNGQKFN